jgi:hypothetical protein
MDDPSFDILPLLFTSALSLLVGTHTIIRKIHIAVSNNIIMTTAQKTVTLFCGRMREFPNRHKRFNILVGRERNG